MNGEQVQGSPFAFSALPDPLSVARAYGKGLETVSVGEDAEFFVSFKVLNRVPVVVPCPFPPTNTCSYACMPLNLSLCLHLYLHIHQHPLPLYTSV